MDIRPHIMLGCAIIVRALPVFQQLQKKGAPQMRCPKVRLYVRYVDRKCGPAS